MFWHTKWGKKTRKKKIPEVISSIEHLSRKRNHAPIPLSSFDLFLPFFVFVGIVAGSCLPSETQFSILGHDLHGLVESPVYNFRGSRAEVRLLYMTTQRRELSGILSERAGDFGPSPLTAGGPLDLLLPLFFCFSPWFLQNAYHLHSGAPARPTISDLNIIDILRSFEEVQ